jgi:hypothetical protein
MIARISGFATTSPSFCRSKEGACITEFHDPWSSYNGDALARMEKSASDSAEFGADIVAGAKTRN